jgi:hypothetical protein
LYGCFSQAWQAGEIAFPVFFLGKIIWYFKGKKKLDVKLLITCFGGQLHDFKWNPTPLKIVKWSLIVIEVKKAQTTSRLSFLFWARFFTHENGTFYFKKANVDQLIVCLHVWCETSTWTMLETLSC